MSDLSKYLLEYLEQYTTALRRRRTLENRLKNICLEMNRPIGGIDYSPVNVHTSNISSGSAAFTMRKSEIEERISEQIEKAGKDLLLVMDILEYLPRNDCGRQVLEMRYIDDKRWWQICRDMPASRSTAFEWRDKAIAQLLTYKRVQTIVEEYAKNRHPGVQI